MNEVTRNSLVGLFVLLAFCALGLLMVWFGETPTWLGSSEWTLRISGVSELRGIGDGSPVNMNGVEIGRVQMLEFENPERPHQGVRIVTRVKKQYSVPNNAFARVYGATLGFGSGRIEIVVPGDSHAPLLSKDPRDLVQIGGEMRSVVGEVISRELLDSVNRAFGSIADLTEAWAPVGPNLARILEQRSVSDVDQPGHDPNMTANLTTVIERVDKLIANLNDVLGDESVQEDVRGAVRDLKSAASEIRDTVTLWREESKRIVDNVNTGIDRTKENLDHSFQRILPLLEHLDDSARTLAVVMMRIDRGEGTAGLLTRDERLYEAAVLSLERLAESLATLQRILGKIEHDGYITVGQAPTGLFRKNFPVSSAASPSPP